MSPMNGLDVRQGLTPVSSCSVWNRRHSVYIQLTSYGLYSTVESVMKYDVFCLSAAGLRVTALVQ